MQISVVIPCLNEEKTIGKCILKAQEGIRALGYAGEILVVDNGSTDDSKKKAFVAGARVVEIKERGYGSAIRGGLNEAAGTYVVIGDADDSYDFRTIPLFIRKIETGNYDLVIGNRFSGHIEHNAMPFLNRYLGNPVLTSIGKLLFGSTCNDFHCGLRAGKRESLLSLDLSCKGMEFATEMIIKATTKGMRIGEIPITLYQDGRGRPSHLRRWRDGAGHLIYMIRYKLSKK